MGAQPWYYFMPYDSAIETAFRALREREFLAGRYYPAVSSLKFPIDSSSPSPGAKHTSIEAAIGSAGPNGTRSILDITNVQLAGPRRPGAIVPLTRDELIELYGSDKPSREMVQANMDFFIDLDRGEGIFAILYAAGKPNEILFAGYSYD